MIEPQDLQERLNRRYTLEEYLQLPEGPPYFELENGELIEVKSARFRHGLLMGRVFAYLDTWCRQAGGLVSQEVGTILSQQHGYIPDLVYIAPGHEDRLVDGLVRGIPDLVVEIHTTDGARRDRVQKFNTYLKFGIPWYWLLDYQSNVIEEYHLQKKRYVRTTAAGPGDDFTPHALPGLTIPMNSLL